jgi:hypothetical protein
MLNHCVVIHHDRINEEMLSINEIVAKYIVEVAMLGGLYYFLD